MASESETALLPCPFCGEPQHTGPFQFGTGFQADFRVLCLGCCALVTAHTAGRAKLLWNRRTPSAEAKDAACEWRYHDNDGAWFTSCGQAWSYIDGGPVENGMNFCHCCGKAIAIAQQDAQRGGEVES